MFVILVVFAESLRNRISFKDGDVFKSLIKVDGTFSWALKKTTLGKSSKNSEDLIPRKVNFWPIFWECFCFSFVHLFTSPKALLISFLKKLHTNSPSQQYNLKAKKSKRSKLLLWLQENFFKLLSQLSRDCFYIVLFLPFSFLSCDQLETLKSNLFRTTRANENFFFPCS